MALNLNFRCIYSGKIFVLSIKRIKKTIETRFLVLFKSLFTWKYKKIAELRKKT